MAELLLTETVLCKVKITVMITLTEDQAVLQTETTITTTRQITIHQEATLQAHRVQ